MRYLTLFLLLPLSFSCGKKDTGRMPTEEEVLYIDGSNVQGVYQTTLAPVNLNTTMGNIGSAGVHRSSDIFKAFVKLYLGERGITHRQSIHRGSRCPTLRDDINGDGYVDIREAMFVVGNIIIPLDGNIDSQREGSHLYPQGNGIAGGYFYERTASFSKLFEDLRDVDPNTLDEVDKIPYDKGISFHRKVVLILGVGRSTYLPESINSMSGLSKHQALPMACGVLKRSAAFPAELYDRTDPVTTTVTPSRVRIRPRTPEHSEPNPDIVIGLPDPDPPRRRGLRQRLRRWWRGTMNGEER